MEKLPYDYFKTKKFSEEKISVLSQQGKARTIDWQGWKVGAIIYETHFILRGRSYSHLEETLNNQNL
jgi:hypothetical protein